MQDYYYTLQMLKRWKYSEPKGHVSVKYEKTHDRFAHITVLCGDPQDVIDYAAKLVQNDEVTPMYDHMAYRVVGFDLEKKADGSPSWIKLYKTTYAGD